MTESEQLLIVVSTNYLATATSATTRVPRLTTSLSILLLALIMEQISVLSEIALQAHCSFCMRSAYMIRSRALDRREEFFLLYGVLRTVLHKDQQRRFDAATNQ